MSAHVSELLHSHKSQEYGPIKKYLSIMYPYTITQNPLSASLLPLPLSIAWSLMTWSFRKSYDVYIKRWLTYYKDFPTHSLTNLSAVSYTSCPNLPPCSPKMTEGAHHGTDSSN
jgi:hypothetical protein